MRSPYQHIYQVFLIIFAIATVALTGAFFIREIFPEYKVYQNTYEALENFRAHYMNSAPPPFSKGIKQILFYSEKPGPESLDRCISCHVATNLEHFSPTRIARDINGQIRLDATGIPLLEANPDYVFTQLKETDEASYKRLRFQTVAGLPVDMERVLQMHPLIGSETRPFEYHPLDTYGCTTCHSGNGRSVAAKNAHGPVYDEMYEAASRGVISPYVEVDTEHDPLIATVFNFEPDHELLFQTTPLLPGALMDAKCVKCHQPSQQEMEGVVAAADVISTRKMREVEALQQGLKADKAALATVMAMRQSLQTKGLEGTAQEYGEQLQNPLNSPEVLDSYAQRLNMISDAPHADLLLARLSHEALELLGSAEKVEALEQAVQENSGKLGELVAEAAATTETGSIATKRRELALSKGVLKQLDHAKQPFAALAGDKQVVREVSSEVDRQLTSYKRGNELFFGQACYACHRIEGLSRGGIGPDLSEIGLSYPWYVKLSIVWPQGKLKSSAMPNMKLDHKEVEDLLAFLMAQTGNDHVVSDVDRERMVHAWEMGKKLPLEQPLPPTEIHNLRTSMTVFATQGCAACHKLRGFDGNVAYRGNAVDSSLWFFRRFPQWMSGTQLVSILENNADEIDAHLVATEAEDSMLQYLEAEYPGIIQSYYTAFRFASRTSASPEWQERLERVLTMYIQEYGLGRDIGPRISWSGVWHDDEWLTGHFINPTAYTARSIMPVMPFDMTKFYALNYMLHTLGRENRDSVEEIWRVKGFDPELAFTLYCAACHGVHKQGNGPIAEWIYPLPKNLRNAEFLKNLTREQAILSVTKGVKGTPMPAWGEAIRGERPVLNEAQIEALVDWIFDSVPGGPITTEREITRKWQYNPEDIMDELQSEGSGVSALFEREDGHLYIKPEYYTLSNLDAGKALFDANCKHCHGSEGAGNGPRAETMMEAKPRMLSNLPWLRTRDDLRLLRSIKYGVRGTSMLPWGDRTTALQRIQLVLFIRTLSEETLRRDNLNSALYNTFDAAVLAVENCRVGEYEGIDALCEQWRATRAQREQLADSRKPSAAAAAYEEELELEGQLHDAVAVDDKLKQLIAAIQEERALYSGLGGAFILKRVNSGMMEEYLKWVAARAQIYSEGGKCVLIQRTPEQVVATERQQERIIDSFDQRIAALAKQIADEEAKIRTAKTEELTSQLMEERGGLMNLKQNFLFQTRHANTLQAKQRALYDEYLKDDS